MPVSTTDAIHLDGWRIDVGYPEYQEEAEDRLEKKCKRRPFSSIGHISNRAKK